MCSDIDVPPSDRDALGVFKPGVFERLHDGEVAWVTDVDYDQEVT